MAGGGAQVLGFLLGDVEPAVGIVGQGAEGQAGQVHLPGQEALQPAEGGRQVLFGSTEWRRHQRRAAGQRLQLWFRAG